MSLRPHASRSDEADENESASVLMSLNPRASRSHRRRLPDFYTCFVFPLHAVSDEGFSVLRVEAPCDENKLLEQICEFVCANEGMLESRGLSQIVIRYRAAKDWGHLSQLHFQSKSQGREVKFRKRGDGKFLIRAPCSGPEGAGRCCVCHFLEAFKAGGAVVITVHLQMRINIRNSWMFYGSEDLPAFWNKICKSPAVFICEPEMEMKVRNVKLLERTLYEVMENCTAIKSVIVPDRTPPLLLRMLTKLLKVTGHIERADDEKSDDDETPAAIHTATTLPLLPMFETLYKVRKNCNAIKSFIDNYQGQIYSLLLRRLTKLLKVTGHIERADDEKSDDDDALDDDEGQAAGGRAAAPRRLLPPVPVFGSGHVEQDSSSDMMSD
jgi:hypothetical protein